MCVCKYITIRVNTCVLVSRSAESPGNQSFSSRKNQSPDKLSVYTTAVIYHRTATAVPPLPVPRYIAAAAICNVVGRTAVARIKLHNR